MITNEEVQRLVKELDLSDEDTEAFINDAEDFLGVDEKTQSTLWDRAVKYYAAYLAFISSDLYKSVRVGDIAVTRAVEFKANNLKKLAEDAIKEIDPTFGGIIVDSTYMIDRSRPDFVEGGVEDWYT